MTLSLRMALLVVVAALVGLILSVVVVGLTERYDSAEARAWLREAKLREASLTVPSTVDGTAGLVERA